MQSIILKDVAGYQPAGTALCKALARLPQLRTVVVDHSGENLISGMASALSTLTQIR